MFAEAIRNAANPVTLACTNEERIQLFDGTGEWSALTDAVRPALEARHQLKANRKDLKTKAADLEEELFS